MPELPEVEVIRLFLSHNLTKKTITDLEILWPKSFIGDKSQVVGQEIKDFSRTGKQLSIHLKNEFILLVHLKMTGQLIYLAKQKTILGHPTPNLNETELPNKSTRLCFTFSDNSKLFFNDQRKFGWIKLMTPEELVKFQSNLGVDVLNSKFTKKYFYQELQKSKRPIKLVLLDQNKFAGIGNIYANDALFLAGIHPQNPSNSIKPVKAEKLRQALINIITESISHGGSTAKDNKYIHPDGSFGEHQYHFRVYQKEGESCTICQTPIKKLKIGGRGTYYCPTCQKIT